MDHCGVAGWSFAGRNVGSKTLGDLHFESMIDGRGSPIGSWQDDDDRDYSDGGAIMFSHA